MNSVGVNSNLVQCFRSNVEVAFVLSGDVMAAYVNVGPRVRILAAPKTRQLSDQRPSSIFSGSQFGKVPSIRRYLGWPQTLRLTSLNLAGNRTSDKSDSFFTSRFTGCLQVVTSVGRDEGKDRACSI
ncbi:hypothetical protein L798_08297 [Zootermopsis nevadensis]|uniref:Uncharacterized protein n=1 Tax=Zootermopsis nevadensis TaxID=136037 RepID=A0A067R2E5_ZOONE|nr:hypothetical protein L798_08297 [Zootermopsis nevadensis]